MRKFNPMTLLGMLGICFFGLMFFLECGQAMWADSSVWWTHRSMPLTLAETEDHFELYVGPDLLQKLVEDRALTVRDAEGRERPVSVADIRVRVNNWDRIRADHLRDGVAAALGLGASATLLIVGIVSRASRRNAEGRS